jgi:hypothetical protein
MAVGPVRAVLPSVARTSSGASPVIGLKDGGSSLGVALVVTAVSGVSATLTLSVEWSHDGGTTWMAAQPADVFSEVTAATGAVKTFAVKAPHFRIVYTIGGTAPSITFGVTAVEV